MKHDAFIVFKLFLIYIVFRKVKQKVISAVIQGSRLKIREEPKEISISYLETEEEKICDSGFEMKGSICGNIVLGIVSSFSL